MDVPNFRYTSDAQKFIDDMNKELKESDQLLKKHQKLLATYLTSVTEKVQTKLSAATTIFDVSSTDVKDQQKVLRKLKYKIDPNLEKIVVPNMKKLEKQYNLAEDFYAKLKAVETAETQVQMSFAKHKGPEYEALMAQFATLKTKIQDSLKDCLQFLSDVAQKHVPKEFQEYIDMVTAMVNEHVICRDSQSFMYVSVDPEGNLVFTSYLMLQHVANDEGDVAPHLYVSIQWVISKDPTIHVELSHEYEVPNKLLGQGDKVSSVKEAVNAIATLLELENYSSALGVVPLAIQMNIDPTSITPSMFHYGDVIDKVKLDDKAQTLTFVLKSQIKEKQSVAEISAMLYQEIKSQMKTKGVKLTMKESASPPFEITFKIVTVAQGGEFSDYDFEWMRSKFGFTQTQLRKIAHMINQNEQ